WSGNWGLVMILLLSDVVCNVLRRIGRLKLSLREMTDDVRLQAPYVHDGTPVLSARGSQFRFEALDLPLHHLHLGLHLVDPLVQGGDQRLRLSLDDRLPPL